MTADAREPAPLRWLRRLIDIRPGEGAALAWAWCYIFAVLTSYYIMRPIRDEMGVAGGVNNLPWLFTGTLVLMLVLNVPFGFLVKKLPRRRFIAVTYRFFALNILAFAAALHVADPAQSIWIGRFFFIWISVFNLFVVSVFWALIVDVFDSEQGKRLFGFIAAGATLGAILGSAIVATSARSVAPPVLLVSAALLLEVAVFASRRLSHDMSDPRAPGQDADQKVIGGNVLAGFTKTFQSPYLFNTGLFLLLFAITSTWLYFTQASLVSHHFATRAEQTAFFATVDLAVNVLTLVVQLFLTGRVVRLCGVAVTLALLPALSIIGFGWLALMPTIAAVVVFQVSRRAGNFAIARPTREVLFTVVPREDRYKAKSFIDTVVYRTGDQLGAWSYGLIGFFGWTMVETAVAAAVLSAAWLINSVWLGRRQERQAKALADEAVARERLA